MVYRETTRLPDSEKYGPYSQMRRAVISIPSNLAEGHGRSGSNEYIRFIDIALGSLRELETQVEICKRLSFFESQELIDLKDRVGNMFYGIRKGVKDKS
jgi:four helix bundle protein